MSEILLGMAIKAAIDAGKEILNIYNSEKIQVTKKKDMSPLTKADLISNQIIVNQLKLSNIPILSEESESVSYDERKKWQRFWVVDPLDGTKEFIKRNGEFTVNISLVKKNKPIIGVVYAPVLKLLYFAMDSIGSYKKLINQSNYNINNIINKSERIFKKNSSNVFTVVASRSHPSVETTKYIDSIQKKYQKKLKIINAGSSLKFCLVAEGKADVYPRFVPSMEWDTAAGHAICKSAGVNIIDIITSKELTYNKKILTNNYFICK